MWSRTNLQPADNTANKLSPTKERTTSKGLVRDLIQRAARLCNFCCLTRQRWVTTKASTLVERTEASKRVCDLHGAIKGTPNGINRNLSNQREDLGSTRLFSWRIPKRRSRSDRRPRMIDIKASGCWVRPSSRDRQQASGHYPIFDSTFQSPPYRGMLWSRSDKPEKMGTFLAIPPFIFRNGPVCVKPAHVCENHQMSPQ